MINDHGNFKGNINIKHDTWQVSTSLQFVICIPSKTSHVWRELLIPLDQIRISTCRHFRCLDNLSRFEHVWWSPLISFTILSSVCLSDEQSHHHYLESSSSHKLSDSTDPELSHRSWVLFRSSLLSSPRCWALFHRYHRHRRRLPSAGVPSSQRMVPPCPCPCFFPRPHRSSGPTTNLPVDQLPSPLDRRKLRPRMITQLMPNWCFSSPILHPDWDWNSGGQLPSHRHHWHLLKTKSDSCKSPTTPWGWWFPSYPFCCQRPQPQGASRTMYPSHLWRDHILLPWHRILNYHVTWGIIKKSRDDIALQPSLRRECVGCW